MFTIPELIQLFFMHTKLIAKTTLEYKFHRSLVTFAIFAREMISIVIMYLIMARFVKIKGWDMNEMLFLYSFLFLSYSLFAFVFAGIRDFDRMVQSGELDRFLLRPLGVMYQVIASRSDFSATLGHGLVAILLLIKTAGSVGIEWNLRNISVYIAVVLGGTMIQAALFMISSCFSFWTINTTNLRNLVFFNARRFAAYPISFYPKVIQSLLIFVLPFAFVNYYPTLYFLEKPEIPIFWGAIPYLTPAVGILTFGLVYLFWKFGMNHYSSVGN
ncbi:MAG TPA: ABC-2 family transporter protein [Clostridia bacterium]|nr:ABC-2 family transporter protein [Clostridia bacterium]